MTQTEVRKSEGKRSKYRKVHMMRDLEAVKDRFGLKEGVRSPNVPTATSKRRVLESFLFSC
jgi:hypothetical protein